MQFINIRENSKITMSIQINGCCTFDVEHIVETTSFSRRKLAFESETMHSIPPVHHRATVRMSDIDYNCIINKLHNENYGTIVRRLKSINKRKRQLL